MYCTNKQQSKKKKRYIMISMDWKYKAIFIGTMLVSGTLNYEREPLWDEIKPKESAPLTDVDCEKVLIGNVPYIHERVKHRGTVSDPGPGKLNVSCEGILARHPIFPEYPPLVGREKKFSIAFARVVYRDYMFLEAELAANYEPYNLYCYALDQKTVRTDKTFRERMKALADCVPNVMLTTREFDIDRFGRNMWNAYLECMKMLLAYNYRWEYLITLQNWDIQLRNHKELVQIFKWLNGTNDIQYTHLGAHYIDFSKHNWTLAHLHLFRNDSKNLETNSHGALLELKKTKGQVQCSLSRAFVEWLINDLDTEIMLDQLNSYEGGVKDELFIPTLASNEFLHAPGGFTRHCYGKTLAPGLTRFTIWHNGGKIAQEKCKSGNFRNYICIFGLEDLRANILRNKFLFVNKVQPEFDADLVQCWHLHMYWLRYDDWSAVERHYEDFYRELPQVRYNEIAKRDGHVNLEDFNCTYKFLKEVGYGQEWFYVYY